MSRRFTEVVWDPATAERYAIQLQDWDDEWSLWMERQDFAAEKAPTLPWPGTTNDFEGLS